MLLLRRCVVGLSRGAHDGMSDTTDPTTADLIENVETLAAVAALSLEQGHAVRTGLFALIAPVRALAARLADYEKALTTIRRQQPKTLGWMRSNGVVFRGPLGADPTNMEHVAFSVYTDLCEASDTARAALDGEEEDEDE